MQSRETYANFLSYSFPADKYMLKFNPIMLIVHICHVSDHC